MAHSFVGYTTHKVGLAPEHTCTTSSFVFYMLWMLALLIPTFNVIVLEARVVRVLNRFTQRVKVMQRGDESLQRRQIICERLNTGPCPGAREVRKAYHTSESGCLYDFPTGGERYRPMFRSMNSLTLGESNKMGQRGPE